MSRTVTDTEISIPCAVAYCCAKQVLERDGEVPLGTLIDSIRRGDKAFFDLPDGFVASFSGVSGRRTHGIYEFVLQQLERQYGPLICEDRNAGSPTNITWGYAGPYNHESACSLAESGDPDVDKRLLEGFSAGHPDRRDNLDNADLPRTTWRRLTLH